MKAKDWQPISSAPLDGTIILVCRADRQAEGVPVDYAIVQHEDFAWYDSHGLVQYFGATHWQPLEPPNDV
jgi:hypothetical protein